MTTRRLGLYCPKCRAEYVAGFTRCTDCDLPLVEELPPRPERARKHEQTDVPRSPQMPPARTDPPDHFELVSVLATSDPGLMAVAKSLLQSAQIPFVAEGEAIQDLFGIGRLSFNPLTGAAVLRVAPQDTADARALLADLETPGPEPTEGVGHG